ncbi:hypothetical protein [Spirosoma panaciterrae]|uniref:hypothetical protein n=1 Tax=Spirosoma panaciterrae TaxID=496058 RepID=UPI000369DBAB|nr:hypothetical protein [Spirosoma panaciterrae]
MEVQVKAVKERLIQLLDTVTGDGAEYIFHSTSQDKAYRVLIKTPLGHTKICVPHQLLEQDILSYQDRLSIFYQIFPQEVLWKIRNSNPDEIHIPEYRHKPRINWQRMLSWFF